MSLLQRLLLLPLLSPLLAVLLVAAINPQPVVTLRLLTWISPALSLGVWIGGAAATGAGLSAAAAALALRSAGPPLQQRRRGRHRDDDQRSRDNWSAAAEGAAPAPSDWSPWAGPSRAATEPAPTVSVPFRVIRKGAGRTEPTPPTATPTSHGRDRPGNHPLDDGWGVAVAEEW